MNAKYKIKLLFLTCYFLAGHSVAGTILTQKEIDDEDNLGDSLLTDVENTETKYKNAIRIELLGRSLIGGIVYDRVVNKRFNLHVTASVGIHYEGGPVYGASFYK